MIRTLLLLCWEFFRTGLLAVGGGMATIPFLTSMTERYPEWLSLAELADMIAVSESTPGPVGINMATYVGFHVAGVGGAFLATFSLVLPSFIVIVLIARAMDKWKQNRLVQAGFKALRPAVTGLIAAAGWTVLKIALFPGGAVDWALAVLFLVILVLTQVKKLSKVHPVAYIAAAGALGVIFKL